MDEKKQTELEKMYALRAGLSIISQKSDELESYNNSTKQMQIEVAQLKSPQYNGKTNADVEKEINKLKENEEYIVGGSSQIVLNLCKQIKHEDKLFFHFLRKGVPRIIDFFQDTILDNTSDFSSSLWIILMIISYVLIVPISIPIILFDIISFPFILFNSGRLKKKKLIKGIKNDKNFEYIEKYLKNHPNDITYMERDMVSSLRGMLEDSNYEFSKLDNEIINKYNALTPTAIVHLQNYIETCKELKEQVGYEEVKRQREEYKNKCAEFEKSQKEKLRQYEEEVQKNNQLTILVSAESQAITNALENAYASVLDIRDWENLDLVIYYYETGRADSIKEALQLVDVERRNNNLIECIQQASNEIYSSIKFGISELGNAMIQGFQSLSAQIDAQRVQTVDAINGLNKKVNKKLVEISADLNKSVSQQQLSNALLAKANVSSKQMVEQMKELNRKVKS